MSSAKHSAWVVLFFPLLACIWFGFGQDQTKKPGGQTIQVQVEMVSLPVVVTTRDGRRVTDLQKEDFQIFEDRVPQQIEGFEATDAPISIALALDSSGSMEKRLVRLQNEAIRFVNLLHPDDSVAVMSFADDVNLLEDFSLDRKRNARGIKETRADGNTALYEAVWLGLEEVLKPIKERNALVLFTDGVDTASRRASEKETMQLAKEAQASIYCIYFNTEGDTRGVQRSTGTIGGFPWPPPPVIVTPGPPVPGTGSAEYMAGRLYLQQLAEYSGGLLFDALSIEDLGPAFESIARELASQYSIGYYSNNTKRDGKFRNVEVRIRRPGLVARTRKGYFAPKAAKD
jgi:Ca-activated chloride channel family protein